MWNVYRLLCVCCGSLVVWSRSKHYVLILIPSIVLKNMYAVSNWDDKIAYIRYSHHLRSFHTFNTERVCFQFVFVSAFFCSFRLIDANTILFISICVFLLLLVYCLSFAFAFAWLFLPIFCFLLFAILNALTTPNCKTVTQNSHKWMNVWCEQPPKILARFVFV